MMMAMSVSSGMTCEAAMFSKMGVPCLRSLDGIVQRRVPSTACSLVLGLGASSCYGLKVKRASSVPFFTDGSSLGASQHFHWRPCTISRSTRLCYSKGTAKPKSQACRLQATSLQAITEDHDSHSGDGVGSSCLAMKLSSGGEDLRSLFVSTLQGLQEGLTKLKERDWLKSSKESFDAASVKLKTVGGKLLENASEAKVRTHGARMWHNLEPWIKWPLAIFSAAFLVVSVLFGLNVTQDLIPLWIMGPLIIGGIIRTAFWTRDLIQKFFVSSEPLRQAAIDGALQVFADVKSGELFPKLSSLLQLKSKELNEWVATKRAELVEYVKSGQAATDFQMLMMLKFSQLREWSSEMYADFVEWVRPYWRSFARLLKKLF